MFLSEVKTKDLLILDEPTDGFSQEQINRMQEIFEKLNTTQMINISHERNLDSFVTFYEIPSNIDKYELD